MEELEKAEHYSRLLDIYGGLLGAAMYRRATDHYYSDFSFSEIAQREHTSRSAVYLSIKAAEKQLDKYEKKLGISTRLAKVRGLLDKIENCDDPSKRAALVKEIRRTIEHGI